MRAVLLDRAGWLAGVTGRALYRAGLGLCGLAGTLDAMADQAGIWDVRQPPEEEPVRPSCAMAHGCGSGVQRCTAAGRCLWPEEGATAPAGDA